MVAQEIRRELNIHGHAVRFLQGIEHVSGDRHEIRFPDQLVKGQQGGRLPALTPFPRLARQFGIRAREQLHRHIAQGLLHIVIIDTHQLVCVEVDNVDLALRVPANVLPGAFGTPLGRAQ